MPAAKKAATATNIHAILGTDEAAMKEAALRLVQKLTPPDAGDFSNDVIDGVAENADHAGQICSQVMQALQTLPFFGGGKVVWLKNANFIGDSVTGRAQAAVEGFEHILDVVEGGIGDDVKFVISATSIDKRRTSYKRLSKLANIEVHDKPDTSRGGWEQEAMAQASRIARERNITFETGALDLLVQMCGDDTRQMTNELEKIDLYLGERRRAGVRTVRDLVSVSRAGVIWEIGNAIGVRDLRRALDRLRMILEHGEKKDANPIGILLGAIVPKVRSLLLIKDLVSKHRLDSSSYQRFSVSLEALPSAATSHLPRKKDGSGFNAYPLFLAIEESRRYSLAELHDAFAACLEANSRLVTSQLDPRLVLERLLVGMMSPQKKKKAA
jgi:DNA polymerase III subunit delta